MNSCGICGLISDRDSYKCAECGILYCSVVCFQNALHIECYEKFRTKDLKKILNNSLQTSDDYDSLSKSLQKSTIINTLLKEKEPLVVVENCDIDFGDYSQVWKSLNHEAKEEFFKFLRKSVHTQSILQIALPWWMVMCLQNSSKYSAGTTDSSNLNEMFDEVVPHLLTNDIEKSSVNMNRKAFSDFNEVMAIFLHRLLLTYIAVIRIYGNRQNVITDIHFHDILHLVPYLGITDTSCLGNFKTYDKLIMDFEVDTLKYFQNNWNYSDFKVSEQFFIELYHDYMILLAEKESENKIPLMFYALSDIYYSIPKKHASYRQVRKKIIFLISWYRNYCCNPKFLVIFNFLQFRITYLQTIVENMSNSNTSIKLIN